MTSNKTPMRRTTIELDGARSVDSSTTSAEAHDVFELAVGPKEKGLEVVSNKSFPSQLPAAPGRL